MIHSTEDLHETGVLEAHMSLLRIHEARNCKEADSSQKMCEKCPVGTWAQLCAANYNFQPPKFMATSYWFNSISSHKEISKSEFREIQRLNLLRHCWRKVLKEILSYHIPIFQDLNDSGDLDNAIVEARVNFKSVIQLQYTANRICWWLGHRMKKTASSKSDSNGWLHHPWQWDYLTSEYDGIASRKGIMNSYVFGVHV